MTAFELKIILLRHKTLLLLVPILTAAAIFFFLSRKENSYTSDSSIFTGIASTYRISGDNNDNNEGSKQLRLDMAISDMLIIVDSRETKKEVALSLLAQHLMMDGYNTAILSNENYDRLKLLIPDGVRKKLRGASFDETLINVTQYCNANNENELYRLINSLDPIYSISALSNISVSQLKTSEMVQLEYSSPDPAVSQQTLKFFDDIFIHKQKALFATQTASVIGYFDTSVQKAYAKLQAAEQKLLAFNKANNILDYDQQVTSSTVVKQSGLQRSNDLELQYSGAAASVKSLEDDLKKRGVSNLQSQEIIRLRNQLSDVTSQITNLEASGNNSDADKIAKLKQSATDISAKIKDAIDGYYSNTHSAQGVPVKDMVDEYLKSMMSAQQLKSQLDVIHRQNEGLSGQYNRLVPLGSESRRIKREIEVAQQDYLAQIEGLKQSKLTQENMDLFSSQVKVLDSPNFPDTPSSAKLPILMAAGFIAAFLLTASLIIALYLLDNSLKTPVHAMQQTGMPVMSVLPKVHGKHSKRQKRLIKRTEESLARQVLVEYNKKQEIDRPFLIGVLSTHSGEGNDFVGNSITNKLNEWGIITRLLVPIDQVSSKNNPDASSYNPLKGMNPDGMVPQLDTTETMGLDIVVIEFPPLLEENYPVSLLQQLDLAVVVINARRTWQKADKLIMESISRLLKKPARIVLTSVAIEYVKEYTGFQKRSVNKPVVPISDIENRKSKRYKEPVESQYTV